MKAVQTNPGHKLKEHKIQIVARLKRWVRINNMSSDVGKERNR
jgi:hypothetical protein